MGARTNYTIVTTNNPEQNINVYAHWDGDQSVQIMQHAIEKASNRIKMNDIAYATRIIIDNLTEGGRDSETGYGIYAIKRGDRAGFWDTVVTIDCATAQHDYVGYDSDEEDED